MLWWDAPRVELAGMGALDEFYGPNAGYVAELLERAENRPGSLDAATRARLADVRGGVEPAHPPRPPAQLDVSLAAAAADVAQAIRSYGHRCAQLDPLGSSPPGDPQLELTSHGIREEDLATLPASVVGGPVARSASNATEALARLRAVYSSTTGYELAHVEDPDERAWLFEAVEDGRFRPPTDPIDERELLDRLTEISAFERFLQRAYPGQTRFSIEGLGMLVPMLDELIAGAGADGVRTIALGMAHRGRLNVLAHVLGKPYERILAEFEGHVPRPPASASESHGEGWAGDVKYHAGGQRAYRPEGSRGSVSVIMAPNPSHLEAVDPVVEGIARAAARDASALAVQVHGDAAFPGQGVVAETLNLSRLPGYSTAGTIHVIENNQLGFTTEPRLGRSTLYASDLAKGFEIPIVHVNASDPVACLVAVRLAVAYRTRYRKDFLIDLIGYRRWGHNEGDEPSFTQPEMYATIRDLPTVREQYAQDLLRRGIVKPGEPDELLQAGLDEFQRIRERVLAAKGENRASPPGPKDQGGRPNGRADGGHQHAEKLAHVSLSTLRELNAALTRMPEGFELNPKLARPIQRRRAAFEDLEAPIDWGHAETLAFATILRQGTPIRLTGQDTLRGTFSQRHLTFYDATTGQPYTPLLELPGPHAHFEVWNSPLSENAPLGFEYGYSVQNPDTLVIWEAQYGDFVNGAQTVIDEFVVSGEAKWGLRSGLVLLLPHAWEGQGPDHSSGRLERFLQLSAERNIRVANCTTAGQYFHLLRRQAGSLAEAPKPLVVLTPKSLLRHPLAAAHAPELAEGTFHPVLDDAAANERRRRVRRVVLCSGKVWADVQTRRGHDDDLALLRVEQLYPFPTEEVRALVHSYTDARELVWLQEEPQNMGAWAHVRPALESLLGGKRPLEYVGRPAMASPAEGWADAHAAEQERIVQAVLGEVTSHAR